MLILLIMGTASINRPRFALLYSPLQFAATEMAKPDGSLSLPYLAGALRRAGYEVEIYDASVGNDKDALADTFYAPRPLPSGLFRVGVPEERILEEVASADVVGISSIFTPQTTMVLETVRLIKRTWPDKLVLAGGVNARSMLRRFFDAGVDVVCLSEAEDTIVEIADAIRRGDRTFHDIDGIARRVGGAIVARPKRRIVQDLDELPIPAWDLLPNERYWAISRPHGGVFTVDARIRYASVMTSRGCPFRCPFCHISNEDDGADSGPIAGFRVKSLERVIREFEILKGLGAEYLFIEDDSLLARKKRMVTIFRELRNMGLRFADVNGVNLIHLFKRESGRLVPDRELIEQMVDIGFESLSLPFESASPRILEKHAGGKWRPDLVDTVALVRTLRDAGLADVHGNYMIGYPDETEEEIEATIDLARLHMDAGLSYALFFAVVPYPGSRLFDIAIREGMLPADFDPDAMKWTEAVMTNTTVLPEKIRAIRDRAWHTVNRPEYVAEKHRTRVEHLGAEAAPLPLAPRTGMSLRVIKQA